MPPAHASTAQNQPPFDMREDGKIRTNWRTVVAVVSFAALAGGAYFKLQDHDRRLAAIEVKIDQTQEIAIEIRALLPNKRDGYGDRAVR